MSDLVRTLELSASGMKAQSARLRYVSENIANVDTPGFRRKLTSFQIDRTGAEHTGLVKAGPVRLDRSRLEQIYDPSHPMADDTGHYEGSNVELMVEIADARQAQRSYEANLKVFDQARQMASSLFELLRK
ncbi:flagellar basal body rod protein FlgC [Tropicimonas sp.]|uniref:flagellar basal body rod protein FlgC n=1 Tax=Tropicimonas sp. TaxID=2067044 RepID=UPI003A8902F6